MWEKKSLGVIADVYNGNSINADYKKNHFLGLAEGLPFIATKDVLSNGEIDYENGVKVPLDAGLKIAPADSVFVCAEGGSAGKKIAFVKEDVCFGNKLFCIHPKKKELYSAKYIYYFCRSELFREQFFGELTGLIGGVSAKKFRNIECPIPPLPEQERIVSLLDAEFAKIDAIKANAEKQLQDAKALFQSALKDYLTPKEGWEEKRLDEICSKIIAGGDAPNKDFMSKTKTPDYPYPIFSNGVENRGLYGYTNQYKVSTPAITIAARGTIGATFIRLEPFTPVVRLITIIPNDYIDIQFLYYLIKALNLGHTGTTIPQLTVPNIREKKFKFPDKKLQLELVSIFSQIDNKVNLLTANYEQTVTLCNDLKQSILKDIFG
jgi:type I restriction enzyme S subunit